MTFDTGASGGDIAESVSGQTMTAERLFRFGGVFACIVVSLPVLVRLAIGDVEGYLHQAGVQDLSHIHLAATRLLLLGLHSLLVVFFCVAFLLTVRPGAQRSRWPVILLVLQTLAAIGSSDYAVVVAAQAPFVFRPHTARAWLLIQIALFMIVTTTGMISGLAAVMPDLAGMPRASSVVLTAIYLATWQLFAFGLGHLAASEGQMRRHLQHRTRELLATQQLLAESSRLAERTQIWRELHDSLGHHLTVLNVNLQVARHQTNGQAAEAIEKAQHLAKRLLSDVRAVVHSLAAQPGVDLAVALATLAGAADHPVVHVSVPPDIAVADPSKAHAVFRCVQEAITNAMRHSAARNVWVEVSRTAGAIETSIRDDGRGAPDLRAGHGLQAMRDRIESVGGTIDFSSASGQGFAIRALIPAEDSR